MKSINTTLPTFARLLTGVVLMSLVLGVVGAALIAAPAAHAQAATAPAPIECGSLDIGCGIGKGIAYLLNVISDLVGWLIHFLADGIELLLDYSARIVEMPAVQAGFQVSLSIVNIVFVMALIITAFEIILGYHEGEAKKRLAKVIIAAVLINFSFLFAGFLLDISNVFTNFFVSSVTSDNLRIALRPEQLQAMHQLSATASGGFFDTVAPMLFKLFISGIMLVILISVFATVLVRILWVACLLLVMPLSWSFWVFPGLEKYHSQWWSEFMKWGVTMMPTIVFFMYIGIQTVGQMSNWTGQRPIAATSIMDTLQGVVQMLIIGGIMVAGLKISQSAGAISASAALGVAGKTTSLLTRPITNSKMMRSAGRKTAGVGSKILSSINNIPYVGAATDLIGLNALTNAAANKVGHLSHADHDIENAQKERFSSLGDQQLFAFKARGVVEQAAKLAELAKRKKINDFMDPSSNHTASAGTARAELIKLVQAAGDAYHKHGSSITDIAAVKDVLEGNPGLAPQIDPSLTITKQVQKTPPNKIAEYKAGVFKGPGGDEITRAILADTTKMRALVNQGSEDARAAFTAQMNNLLSQVLTDQSSRDRVDVIANEIRSLNAEIIEAKRNGDATTEGNLRGTRLSLTTERDNIVASITNPTDRATAEKLLRQRDTMNEFIDGRTTI